MMSHTAASLVMHLGFAENISMFKRIPLKCEAERLITPLRFLC